MKVFKKHLLTFAVNAALVSGIATAMGSAQAEELPPAPPGPYDSSAEVKAVEGETVAGSSVEMTVAAPSEPVQNQQAQATAPQGIAQMPQQQAMGMNGHGMNMRSGMNMNMGAGMSMGSGPSRPPMGGAHPPQGRMPMHPQQQMQMPPQGRMPMHPQQQMQMMPPPMMYPPPQYYMQRPPAQYFYLIPVMPRPMMNNRGWHPHPHPAMPNGGHGNGESDNGEPQAEE